MTPKQLVGIACSVLVLVLPDILLNLILYHDYRNILYIASKIALFVFTATTAAVILRSSFLAYLLVGGVYLVSSCFELVNVLLLNQYVSMDNLKALVTATTSESREFVDKFGVLLLLDVVVVAVFVFCLTQYKGVRFAFSRRLAATLGASFFVAAAVPVMWVFDSEQRFAGRDLVQHVLRQKFLKEHPLSLYYRTYEVGVYTARYSALMAGRSSFAFGVTAGQARPQVVVLVIGEGMRYSNWSVNGYHRPTSPNLTEISNLFSFRRHYSNANSTAASLPLLITQATPENESLAYAEKSIISLYKEAGYQTSWILNEDVYYLDNRDEPDHAYDLFETRRFDADVLPVLSEVLASAGGGNTFIMVNLAGNHGDTPESFTKTFLPNSGSSNPGEAAVTAAPIAIVPDNKAILVNDYDSRILYQDYVLSEIIRRVESVKTTSLVLFTADHGVNLFDDGDSDALFGYGSSNPTQKELHVPLFLWLSDEYQRENPEMPDVLSANTESLSTNDDLFYTLADLSNIEYRFFDERRSLASRAYRPESKIQVLLNGELVFREFQTH